MVTVEKRLADGSLSVYGNHGQIQQIVLNLLFNGWESIVDDGQVVIETGIWEEDSGHDLNWIYRPTLDGQLVYLTVRDSGVGTEHPLPKLFDPFFTTKELGRGFGLAATLGAVRASGGAIGGVTGGQGTTFTVLLPMVDNATA